MQVSRSSLVGSSFSSFAARTTARARAKNGTASRPSKRVLSNLAGSRLPCSERVVGSIGFAIFPVHEPPRGECNVGLPHTQAGNKNTCFPTSVFANLSTAPPPPSASHPRTRACKLPSPRVYPNSMPNTLMRRAFLRTPETCELVMVPGVDDTPKTKGHERSVEQDVRRTGLVRTRWVDGSPSLFRKLDANAQPPCCSAAARVTPFHGMSGASSRARQAPIQLRLSACFGCA